MSYLINMLVTLAYYGRIAGIIVISLVAIGVLISEGAKSKLSPGRTIMVTASAILAGVCIWLVPSLINYARYDVNSVVPDYPVQPW